MRNETGDMKILGNFRRLIDMVVPAEAKYNTTNADLKLLNLETKLTAGSAAVADIAAKLAPNKAAINERQRAYAEAVTLVRGSRNILKSSGASDALIADADTFTRKIFGLRKSAAKPDDENTTAEKAVKAHSAAQLSYDAVLGNILSYIEIVKVEPLYNPNEAEYKIAALTATADDLEAKNNAVSATFVPLNNARALRDELLYTGENCLCDLAKKVKAYVKAIHGANSQLYKAVNALSFKRNFS